MKIEILAPVNLGFSAYPAGYSGDFPGLIADAWVAAGKARPVQGEQEQPARAPAPAAAPKADEQPTAEERIRGRVAALREEYTVGELRRLYEETLGTKPARGAHEEDLANAIAAAEAKGL